MNFSIGLTGLKAAQQALELVGTNLANAGTEGYHRQEIRFSSIQLGQSSLAVGSGVRVDGATRVYDILLERENLRQQPILGQLDQELQGLYSLEAVMGQVDNNLLGESIRDFFSSLNNLAADPTSTAYAQQVIWTGDAAAVNFRNTSQFLSDLKLQIRQQAENLIIEINSLAENVAQLNHAINLTISQGSTPNVLFDRRDAEINKLAELAGVSVSNMDSSSGAINISVSGMSLVLNSKSGRLEVGLDSNGLLGVVKEGLTNYNTVGDGGKISGLMNLYNDVVRNLNTKLDTLAQQFMYEFNTIQSQGIGRDGSFTSLDGSAVIPANTMAQWQPPVANGKVYLRLIDPSAVPTSYEITINSGDTLSDVVNAINLISPGNISANIVNNALHIETANNYKFDFIPDNTIITDGSDGTSGLDGVGAGVDAPSVTTFGIYEGSNQKYNFKFVVPAPGTGEIGVDNNIGVQVRNGAGELVKTIAVGNGYAAGDRIEIEDGLYVSFRQGTVTDGEDFSIITRSNSDTAGFLISAGLNTFFEGVGASDMIVRPEFYNNPMLLGTVAGPDGQDNINVLRMAEISEANISGLGGKEIMDFFHEFGTDIGQKIMTRESRNTALLATARELESRLDQISGVDLNTEVAKLLVYERMFQSMSKFISVQDELLENLMSIL